MLENVKSISRYVVTGAALGAVASAPFCAWVGSITYSLDRFSGGRADENREAASRAFHLCMATMLPKAMVVGSVFAAAVGVTLKVAKSYFNSQLELASMFEQIREIQKRN